MKYPTEDTYPLLATERKWLASVTIGHGNMKKAIKGAGVSTVTIRNAIRGFNLFPTTREKLRNSYCAHIK